MHPNGAMRGANRSSDASADRGAQEPRLRWCTMTPAELSDAVQHVVRAAVEADELPADALGGPLEVKVERPKNKDHGDYATNVAMLLSKPAGRPPREVAEVLKARLEAVDGIESVDIAGPGFLNIRLLASAQGALAEAVVRAGAGLRPLRHPRRTPRQPRVHLGQPHRPVPPRSRALGGRGRCARPGAQRRRRRRHP